MSNGNGTEIGVLEDRKDRKINYLLEVSQALIGLSVTGVTLYVAAKLAFADDGGASAQLLLSNAFFLVIGYYFGRHIRPQQQERRLTDTTKEKEEVKK